MFHGLCGPVLIFVCSSGGNSQVLDPTKGQITDAKEDEADQQGRPIAHAIL